MESRFRNLELWARRGQVAEILRTKTVVERFAMIDQFWRLAGQMIRARIAPTSIRTRCENRIRREVARRMSHGA